MFQNIARDFIENSEAKTQSSNKEILKKIFTKSNISLYIIAFMISMVGFSRENIILSLSPFAIAFIASMLSNNMPVGIVYILTLIGTFIKFGTNNFLMYFITSLIFFAGVLLVRPKFQENVNEQRKLGLHLFISILVVQVLPMFFGNFYVYDLLSSIMLAITGYIFYKIFSNSILMIREFGNKKVFSVEEVMGTSLLLCIAICAFENLSIFGYSIRNILSILIVLVLGWKNGILVGATSGVTIGVVIGIIANNEPIMIAAYALSGMIAGIFNKLGKIGVIIGFILGNILLSYVDNGNTIPIIMFQEILIASLGLLAIPKTVSISIDDFIKKESLLPETTGRTLEENRETILKLNSISDAVSDMAKSYQEAASTILDEEDLKEQELSNENIFIDELKVNLDGLEDNILYDYIYNNSDNIIEDIFKYLLKEEIITEKKLVEIFEAHNNYIIGFKEKNQQVENDISKMIKAINYSYRISKMNFIWKKKMDENKKNISSQLEGVSEVISNLADEIKEAKKDKYIEKKEEIRLLLDQKDIKIRDLTVKQDSSGKYEIEVYTDICDDLEGKKCDIKKILRVLNKVFNNNFIINAQECGLRENKTECKFSYVSEDKYKLQIGIAKATKDGSPVSGDSSLQVKLKDGKYLLAISDGMGSGPEAMKSSKIAIKMLERLLSAGFNKDVSLKLINSTLVVNAKDDMYATLDMQILDLYAGNMEFIKNGACPTYIKRKKDVQLLKSVTLPTGIVDRLDLVVYDYDLQDGDILVMCSDGIIESDSEYLNKELWVKYLLEDIQIEDAQKIADIILNEAIDNNYGMKKDDMTVIVTKITKK